MIHNTAQHSLRNWLVLCMFALGVLILYACPPTQKDNTAKEYKGCNNPAAQITEFGFKKANNTLLTQDYQAVIDQDNCTITLEELYDLTNLTASYKTSNDNSVSIGLNVQESDSTSNDFSDSNAPVEYVVTSKDGSVEHTYTVVFIPAMAASNTDPQWGDIVTYSVPGWDAADIEWTITLNGSPSTDHITKNDDKTLSIDYIHELGVYGDEDDEGDDLEFVIKASSAGESLEKTVVIDHLRLTLTLLELTSTNAKFSIGFNLLRENFVRENTSVTILFHDTTERDGTDSTTESKQLVRFRFSLTSNNVITSEVDYIKDGITYSTSASSNDQDLVTLDISGFNTQNAVEGIKLYLSINVGNFIYVDTISAVLGGSKAIKIGQKAAFRIVTKDDKIKVVVFDADSPYKVEER